MSPYDTPQLPHRHFRDYFPPRAVMLSVRSQRGGAEHIPARIQGELRRLDKNRPRNMGRKCKWHHILSQASGLARQRRTSPRATPRKRRFISICRPILRPAKSPLASHFRTVGSSPPTQAPQNTALTDRPRPLRPSRPRCPQFRVMSSGRASTPCVSLAASRLPLRRFWAPTEFHQVDLLGFHQRLGLDPSLPGTIPSHCSVNQPQLAEAVQRPLNGPIRRSHTPQPRRFPPHTTASRRSSPAADKRGS